MHARVAVQEPSCTADLSRPSPITGTHKRAGLVFAAFLLLSSGNAYSQDTVESDRAALVALYNATNGANWRNRTNWLSDEPIGDWYGVETDASGRVSGLDFADNGLTGTLPPEIGNLSHLGFVVFWGNVLTGPVPAALWSLPLELVALPGNQVTGTLPPQVGELADLSFLDLGWTAMTGALPQSMTNLSSLDFLRIEGSYLCAPSNAAFQAWLRTIDDFRGETCVPETGSVDTDRAALVALYNATGGADWRNNMNWLSARPLGEWYGVTTDGTGRVVELDLGWGGLTGALPPEIGNLSRLRQLHFYDNFELTGPLPAAVGNLHRLEGLGLTSTSMYGILPAAVCNLSNLRYLGLSWPGWRGPLPQCMTNLSELDSFGTWETFLCAPANVAYQTWLEGVSDTYGIHTCEPAAIAVAPVELRLRGAVAQSITVTQTAGSDPVMWTAVGTQPWLRVTPAAGIGTAPVTVSVDPVMLQVVDVSAAGAVVLTVDGVSVRVPVTVVREAAVSGLSLRARESSVRLGLVSRVGGTGPPTVRRVPERTERRARRLAGGLPDSASQRSRPRQAADEMTAGDRTALTTLYDATAGDNWWRNTHWLSDRPLGEWYGVTTDSDGRVTALELSDNRLTGSIPPTLGNLTGLEWLDLSRNALTGSIPAAVRGLAGLRHLNLGYNRLTGAIPPGLGGLSNLESLNLQWNKFETPIPPELGNLTQLELLNLEWALVTGPIPPTLGNLTNLKHLDLEDNYALTGPIPPTLGNLTRLEWLALGGNRLEGSIPAALGRLTNLRELRLHNNSLSGTIPPEFGNLTNLGLISLHNNSLTGAIPPDLGRLSLLFYLGLHENMLTGPIPASLGNTDLYWLFLYGNELTGAIPAELGELENLRFLYLQDNALDGSIPAALGELDNLEVLDLRDNTLTGSIPATLGQLSSLGALDLSDNKLTGPIPRDFGALSNLWWLDLRDNALAGPIPSELGGLSELVWLDLAGNGLSGPIPSELGALERLTKLSLWRNDLTGSIPGRLGTLPNLEQLYLGENKLTGPIPAELGGLTNLRQLYLAGNALTGPIPAALGDLTNLEVLHLRNNELTGPIPAELGNLTQLQYLYLNDNELTGTIPPELENLTQLQVFDIRNTGLCVTVDSELHTWIAAIQDFQGTATCQLTLDFTHFANGNGTTSDLVFVNVAPQPVRPALYFYDTEGNPIAAESVVDITGDLEISEDGGLTVLTEMEPLGELTIATHGQGDLVSGSVKVASEGLVGGMLRFDLPGIGEAVVGASQPVSGALFAVRRQEGGITTGVAVHNLEEEAMEVVCELMQEGVPRDAVSLPLEANGQTAWLIDAAFPAADTSDFAGSVRCDAVGEGLFSAVALEMDPGSRIFITLPVFPVNRLAGGRAAVLDFAHFANGDGTTSNLVFVNVSTQRSRPAPTPFHTDIPPIRPAIYFYDTEGNPIAAESVVDVTGDLEVTEDGALTVQTEMEPLGVLTVSTHGQGALVSGSVKVLSDGPIGGMLRFDLPAIGEAVVGASPPISDALFPVRRQEGGITTGVAIHNLESSPGLVRCDLMQEGVLRDAASIPLEANGQTSWLIDQAFPGTDTSDFVGSVRCDAVGEGLFSAVALEMDPGTRVFTALPVVPLVPVEERTDQE